MSIHLMLCAATRQIKPSEKLVLLCLAEAARDDGRRAWPGPEVMMRWSGLSRARVFELLQNLAELGLIEHSHRGQKYQRGEYVVFPDGCCEKHGPVVSASGRADADAPVDSPMRLTLTDSQRPPFESQRPVGTVSASGGSDASLRPNNLSLIHPALGGSSSSGSLGRNRSLPVDADCEHGVDRHASCTKCVQEATA